VVHKDNGIAVSAGNDDVLSDVKLGEDKLPADSSLRGAVTAGIAAIIPPPSWVDGD
jgi:hypothetical protein